MAKQDKNLERIIELLKHIRNEVEPGGSVEEISSYDQYQYYLMKDNEIIEYKMYSMGDGVVGITGVRITNKGHDFLESLGNGKNYEKIKEIAKKRGQKLTEIPLDMAYKLGVKWLENELGL